MTTVRMIGKVTRRQVILFQFPFKETYLSGI